MGGRVITAIPKAALEQGWPWMWMPSLLCLALFFALLFQCSAKAVFLHHLTHNISKCPTLSGFSVVHRITENQATTEKHRKLLKKSKL